MANNDTIAAISTPPGAGGIGIIRMSGALSLTFLQTIFQPADSTCCFESHHLYYGRVVHPDSDRVLDEVLAVFMAAPKTYTREDVVEIHCHGNVLVLQSILELLLNLGVRLADPGEFTKLAYLNGRIDLTRAEAVIDILSAKTRKGIEMAQEQLGGSLYEQVDAVRSSLVQMRAVVEVAIDFPDEDIEIVNHEALLLQLRDDVIKPLKRLERQAEHGKIIRDGVSVVIVGLPNVGKSSLLNTLLQEERALVAPIPGTTRDTIEEYLDIQGLPVRIVDTAGIRQGADEVEVMGIERARKQIDQADLVLFMFDGERGFQESDRELLETVNHKQLLVLANKSDIVSPLQVKNIFGFTEAGLPLIQISAKEQQGIAALKESIYQAVVGGKDQWQEESCAPNVRHKAALNFAVAAAIRLEDGLKSRLSSDLLAIDLQGCLEQLNAIVGTTTTDDVLDVVFKQFCLGK